MVWYAAYGSNLSRARFDVYLRGGTPEGGDHTYPGCRDSSPPQDDRAWECNRRLRFGGTSRTWGGGVALLDSAEGQVPAKLRLYLVTLEQFADVVAQENWLEPGGVDLTNVVVEPRYSIGGGHMYRIVLPLGEIDGRPVLTVTQDEGIPSAAPSLAYLRHIAEGLREAHGLSADEIAAYLGSRPEVSQTYSRDELTSTLA